MGIGHRYMTWVPEFMALLAFLYIPAAMALKKEYRMPPKYTLLLILYIVHVSTGFVVNSMEGGAIIAGARQFFKFIPIFLLPAIIHFENKDIVNFLKLILFIAFIQFPVTIWQRFIQFAGDPSGDPIGGTLGENTSGILSFFLTVVLSFLVTFLLKRKISLKVFLLTFFVCFIPTTINETKITFLLLPFAFILPIYFGKIKLSENISKFVPLVIFASIILLVFIGIYNYMGWGKKKTDIIKWFSDDKVVEKYTDNRFVPIQTAFEKVFFNDMKTIFFGYGGGNLSPAFTKSLESSLVEKFAAYEPVKVSLTKLLWETGYGGMIFFFLLIANIFIDSLKFSRRSDYFFSDFALCMAVFTCFFSVSHLYFQVLNSNLFIYLFFFFSGYLVSFRATKYQSPVVLMRKPGM
ncbi:MAG: hypothetical protein C0412_07960 [Flavobacterium sp.]|nr:hypothetical protein [Flavobacterium sp.]